MTSKVQDMLRATRDFLRPIPPARMANAAAYTLAATRACSVIVAGSLSALSVGGFVVHSRSPLFWFVTHLSVAFAGFLVFLRARQPADQQLAESLALALISVVMFVLAANLMLDPAYPVALYMPAVPLALAAFIPLRPSRLLWLAPFVAVPLVAPRWVHAVPQMQPPLYLVASASFVLGAAAVCQLGRQRWAQLESAQRSLLATERMSSLGRLTASIAHEVKTPLAAARNDMQQLRALTEELTQSIGHPDVADEDMREIVRDLSSSADHIEQCLERAGLYINSIRKQTRLTTSEHASFRPRARLEDIALLLGHELRTNAMQLDFTDVDPNLELFGPEFRFDQILTNLIHNSIDARKQSGKGSFVRVTARLQGTRATLVFSDDGPGISSDDRPHVFQPMYTTKADSGGTGLGLSIARDAARVYFDGDLELAQSEVGARFELSVPLRAGETGGSSGEPTVFEPAVARSV